MKSLKIVLTLLALAIGLGAPVAKAAADASKPPAPKQSAAERLKATYSLTDEQFKQVQEIYKFAAAEKRKIPSTDENKQAKTAEIDKQTRAKVRALLNPEQQAKFDADKSKGGGKDKGGKDGKGKDDGKKKAGGEE